MTQKELILAYINTHGSITPAKMGGRVWNGIMFGSETSKRCRELRKQGVLASRTEGKFEIYSLKVQRPQFNTSAITFVRA